MVSYCLSEHIHVPACEHIHTGTKCPDSDLVHFNTFQKITKPNETWINSQVILQFCISRWSYVISHEIHEKVLEHKKHTLFKGAGWLTYERDHQAWAFVYAIMLSTELNLTVNRM